MPTAPGEPDLAEAMLETTSQPFLVLDHELRVEKVNRAFLHQFRVAERDTRGHTIHELGNGQWDIPELNRLLHQVQADGGAVCDYRVEHEFEQIGKRVMLVNANHLSRPAGPDNLLLAFNDVTERERIQFELEGRTEFAEKLIDSVREALIVMDWDLRVQSANQSFYESFGVEQAETEGRLIYELGNGQWDIPELRRLLEEVLPNGDAFDDYLVEHEFPTIGRRAMLLNGRRLDHLNLILLAIRDVTEEQNAAARQQAMMGELRHRVKNILNNVRALAVQTWRSSDDPESFIQAFQSRIGALSRAQDLVVASPTEAVSIRDIVRSELVAVGAEEGRHYSIDGPDVRLTPRNAQAFAMTIHELTTNAAKYGALSVDGGRIDMTWKMDRRDGEDRLCFRWRESGVQIAEREPKRGFGSKVIEESLPHMLGGSARLKFHRDGAECLVEYPIPPD
ncbi:MAG: sensor histidine protein kinase [Rhodospirillaceae bacterium]|nr:sensor histidine protein kinase [Rhodospirillaceae bacterium]